jgi:hypothetical protein
MPEGYRTAAALRKWVKRGLDYVGSLPPKAAKDRSAGRKLARSKR